MLGGSILLQQCYNLPFSGGTAAPPLWWAFGSRGSMADPIADSAAFESLLSPILGPAYGYALSLTANAADAEDLIQEAALLAFRAFCTFQPATSFRAWFYKILTNRHFERFRSARRRPATVAMEDAEDRLFLYHRTAEAGFHALSEDPARLLMSKLDTEQVLAAIAALPQEYRVVAQLNLVDEMSYPEIAGLLGCPVGTVRSRLHRARGLLQRALWRMAESTGVTRTGGAPAQVSA
jgi:RNA polymerase sigma-70 factor (ECF subfamily)